MIKHVILAASVLLAPVAAFAQPAPSSLEQRIQKLEDEAAVSRIINQYAELLTKRDFDGYAGLFAKEGVWENRGTVKKGAEEIKGLLVGMFGQPAPGYVNMSNYMLVSNILVNVDGDHATANSRQTSISRSQDGTPVVVLGGRYEDEFIRENGEWKILHRIDYSVIPNGDEWSKRMGR
jgi:ketosteroid isomerase-like protein